ncbi:MAG: hypothetical protein JJU28_16430 [Cyclobacteriaceae bacterium]|nr:hypothetical protein [Cyclobacteriaceae bacterium]
MSQIIYNTSLYLFCLLFTVQSALSQNYSSEAYLDNAAVESASVNVDSESFSENIKYEKLESPLVIAIINGIDIETGIVEIEIVNKLVADNKLSNLFGPEINPDLAGIIHTYSEHLTATFQQLADSQPISAFDENALHRLDSINVYYNRKLKVLIHKLLMDTNFGRDTSSMEQWMQQADLVLDNLFELWAAHLSLR